MPTDNLLDDVLNSFTAVAANAYPQLTEIGLLIMASLFVLQLGIVAVGVYSGNVESLLQGLLMGLVRMSVIWAIMQHIYDWGGDIIATGKIIAAQVTGHSPDTITPSGVYDMGLTLTGAIWHATSWGLWFHLTSLSTLVLVTIAIQVTWFAAACVYLWLLLEATFAVTCGGILVCWSALEYTYDTLIAWGGWLLNIAIRIVVMMLMLSGGTLLAQGWIDKLNGYGFFFNPHRTAYAVETLIESLIFFFIVWLLPYSIGRIIRTTGGGSYAGVAQAAAGATLKTGATAVRTAVNGLDGAGKGAAELSNMVRNKLTS